MAPKGQKSRIDRLKDSLAHSRSRTAYLLLLLAALGALLGWGLLPEQVALRIDQGVLQGFVPKNTAILAHFGLSGGFTLLHWWKPRELVFLAAAGLGLLLTYGSLAINLGGLG